MAKAMFLDIEGRKVFAAIVGGFVEFTVSAVNSTEARDLVQRMRKRSESIERVRLLRFDDMPSRDREFADHRPTSTRFTFNGKEVLGG